MGWIQVWFRGRKRRFLTKAVVIWGSGSLLGPFDGSFRRAGAGGRSAVERFSFVDFWILVPPRGRRESHGADNFGFDSLPIEILSVTFYFKFGYSPNSVSIRGSR